MKNRSRIMKSFPITLLVLMLVLSFGSIAAEASPLTNKTLDGFNTYDWNPPSPLGVAVVGAGVEYTSIKWYGSDWFHVDISETGLVTVGFHDPTSGLGHGANQLLTFTDYYSDIDSITGFSFVGASSVTGFNQSKLSFTADSFSLQLGESVNWSPNSFVQAQLEFSPVTSVPEPATMLLLGLGMVGLAGVKRKFNK